MCLIYVLGCLWNLKNRCTFTHKRKLFSDFAVDLCSFLEELHIPMPVHANTVCDLRLRNGNEAFESILVAAQEVEDFGHSKHSDFVRLFVSRMQ